MNEPLVFVPVYKDYLWGGRRIAALYARRGTPEPCAESWEISAHPDGMSVVAEGAFRGMTLAHLTARFGAALVGSAAPRSDTFPLLFKIIDARRRLSVQVHPAGDNAALTGGEPKSEMWYVLDCDTGASLFAGLRAGTGAESLRRALAEGCVAETLTELPIAPGQALFIPGGVVHAIGDGALIYEVQQSSNTVYRLFDWNRTDDRGKPRPLHAEECLATIKWELPPPRMSEPRRENAHWSTVAHTEFFTMRKLEVEGEISLTPDGRSFIALFVAQGAAQIRCGAGRTALPTGTSALIPAAAESCRVESHGPSTLLVTTL